MMGRKVEPFKLASANVGLAAGVQTLRAFKNPAAAASGLTALFPVAVLTSSAERLLTRRKR